MEDENKHIDDELKASTNKILTLLRENISEIVTQMRSEGRTDEEIHLAVEAYMFRLSAGMRVAYNDVLVQDRKKQNLVTRIN